MRQISSFETGRNSWNVSKTAELVGILVRTGSGNLPMKALNLEDGRQTPGGYSLIWAI